MSKIGILIRIHVWIKYITIESKCHDVLCYSNSKILNKYFEESSIKLASSYFDAINHIMDYFNSYQNFH